MKRLIPSALAFLLIALPVYAQEFAPRHLLVKPRPGIQAADVGVERAWAFDSGAELWILPEDWPVEEAAAALNASDLVEYAEPDPIVHTTDVPNDPGVSQQWAWPVIHAFDAWIVKHDSPGVLTALIDTGCTYTHPDLAANIWTNPGEIPGNGLDDDANGYPDDVHGYNFYYENGDPADRNGHGTHTAGTLAAVGNNGIGVTGVNWTGSVMCLAFLGECGGGFTSDAIRATDYARRMGASIMSNSWGCGPSTGCFSQAMFDAIAMARDAGILYVAAAGNNGVNTDLNPNFYPADYALDNIISVAASDQADNRASFSNYGPATTDIAAPGVTVFSTYGCVSLKRCPNPYVSLSGTSMATPHVAGAAALIKALHPEYGYAELKAAILGSGDVLTQWSGLVGCNCRLNLAGAVGFTQPPPPPPPPPNPCGNGVCDSGETCRTCAADCKGIINKQPWKRFCCGDGIKQAPEGDGAICNGNY